MMFVSMARLRKKRVNANVLKAGLENAAQLSVHFTLLCFNLLTEGNLPLLCFISDTHWLDTECDMLQCGTNGTCVQDGIKDAYCEYSDVDRCAGKRFIHI